VGSVQGARVIIETFKADPGPAVEAQVAVDMAKRMLPVLPVLVIVAGLIWGPDGAASGAFAVALVLGNLALSAALLGKAARISLALLMAVKDQSWVDIPALGFTLIVTHLGLLVWETRHVSASLAYPGLKPTRNQLAGGRR
jgi:hypothetical protein